jgi:hypothetical protein
MGQPAERLRDNDNKENKGKQETEDHRETADNYFRSTLEAPGNPESDTDAHLDKATIIFTSQKLQTCKPKQDSDTRPRRRQQKGQDQRTKDKTKEEMVKEDSIMEDHSKHPCKQQRMEQERMKNRIKQTTTAFLTTIIVTLIILNTGSRNRNTTTWTVRTETGQQGRKRRQ